MLGCAQLERRRRDPAPHDREGGVVVAEVCTRHRDVASHPLRSLVRQRRLEVPEPALECRQPGSCELAWHDDSVRLSHWRHGALGYPSPMAELQHHYRVESAALEGSHFDVHRVEGVERLNCPWRFEVSIWTRDTALTRQRRADLLEQPISLSCTRRGLELRRVRGFVAELRSVRSRTGNRPRSNSWWCRACRSSRSRETPSSSSTCGSTSSSPRRSPRGGSRTGATS